MAFHTGRLQDPLSPVLQSMSTPVDYAFIDGHHLEDATLEYFDQIAGNSYDGTVVVFDDIHRSSGMERAWKRTVGDRRIALSVDVGDMGI